MMMELAILDYIQEFMRCSFLDMLMPAVTALGNYGILWIALSVLLLCFPKTRRIGIVSEPDHRDYFVQRDIEAGSGAGKTV